MRCLTMGLVRWKGLRHWLPANTMFYLHHGLRISLPIFPVDLFLPFFRPSIHNCSQRLSVDLVVAAERRKVRSL
jgi:hypothetical protein